ncbi:MAG: shikimate kinase [Candidatus Omnitrophica bacterium]|nr:shikimate kinase [Candidatus Omnitrophota bacterium]
MNNIYLTGMMGSGKSAVAKLLTERLKRTIVDVDALIVQHEGKSINDIFSKNGETYFRDIEKKILEKVVEQKNSIVATGGGIILAKENRDRMKHDGVVVYLKTSVDTLCKRLTRAKDRPLLQGQSLQKKIDDLLKQRSKFYEEADYTIDTTDKTPQKVVEKIVALLANKEEVKDR